MLSTSFAHGIPITEVSRWLGHRSIEVTHQIYGHLVPTSWERARTVLDEARRGTTPAAEPRAVELKPEPTVIQVRSLRRQEGCELAGLSFTSLASPKGPSRAEAGRPLLGLQGIPGKADTFLKLACD
jgi:hypothetical protein